jgi:hypothetical protein
LVGDFRQLSSATVDSFVDGFETGRATKKIISSQDVIRQRICYFVMKTAVDFALPAKGKHPPAAPHSSKPESKDGTALARWPHTVQMRYGVSLDHLHRRY